MKEAIRIKICEIVNKISLLMWILRKINISWYISVKACIGSKHWHGVDKEKWLKEIRS